MIKKLLFCIFLIACLAGCASAVVEIPGGTVSSYNMNVAGETYKLIGDVTATGTAFVVGANNVTLDGGGYNVTFATQSSGSGIYPNMFNNINIKNVNFIQTNTSVSGSYAIRLRECKNCIISNVTGGTVGANNVFYISNACNNTTISDCNILSSSSSQSIYVTGSNYTYINNCIISKTTGYNYYLNGCYYNYLSDCYAVNSGSGTLYGFSSSSYNFINNCSGSTVSGSGIYISTSLRSDINYCNVSSISGNSIFSTGTYTNISNTISSSYAAVGTMLDYGSNYSNVINCTTLSISSVGLVVNSNNNCINYSNISSQTNTGLKSTGSMNNFIANCNISSKTGLAINFVNSSNFNGSDCYISSDSTSSIKLQGSTNCIFENAIIHSPLASAPHATNHILMIGDSITEGGASGILGGYSTYTNDTINNVNRNWFVSCQGVSGETSGKGKNRFMSEISFFHPSIVTIMYGTNDINENTDQQEIINNIIWMANKSLESGAIPYIILTPQIYPDTNNTHLNLDKNLSVQAGIYGINVINGYDALDSIPNNEAYDYFNESNYMPDKVHPNDAGNAVLGEYVGRHILSTLPVNFSSGIITDTNPRTVRYIDNSNIDHSAWYWDFENDGIIDSTKQNPVHTYGKPGTYSVNLTVHNEYGNFSTVKNDYITVTAQTPPSTIDEIWNILKHFFFGLSTQEAAS